jgi:hypothetical protein
MSSDNSKGASYKEQLLSIPNLDNLSLFQTIEQEINDADKFSTLINTSTNVQGLPFLYLLCYKAAWDTLNYILDSTTIQLNDEVLTSDNNKDSCIHGLMRYCIEEEDVSFTKYILENLIECGVNVTIKNANNLTPLDYYLSQTGNKPDEIVDVLMSTEFNNDIDEGIEIDEYDE